MGVRAPVIGVAAFAAAMLAIGLPQPAVAAEGEVINAGVESAVPGKYIVELKETARIAGPDRSAAVNTAARELSGRFRGTVGRTYQHALKGFEISTDAAGARRMAAHPAVAAVHQNQRVELLETQAGPPSWGLDRIDQRSLPLSLTYRFAARGTRVRAYLVDSGIRLDHPDFAGRITTGYDFFSNDADPSDCDGHGTAVGGVMAGSKFGVAKNATIIPLKVFGCTRTETGDAGMLVAALDWLINNHIEGEPAVANLSLRVAPASLLVDNAVQRVISDGVTVVAGAGNDNANRCTNTSPSRVSGVVIVGATDIEDNRWVRNATSGSNYGSCVDLFAPGKDIVSASHKNIGPGDAVRTSGTSLAAPHVSGVVALYLDHNPEASPSHVAVMILNDTTPGAVKNPGASTTSRLVFLEQRPRTSLHQVYVDPEAVTVRPGHSVTVQVHTQLTWGDPQEVLLNAGDLPSGMRGVFSRDKVLAGQSATLTISVADTVPFGSYPVTVTGVMGITRGDGLTINVTGRTTTCTSTAPGPVTFRGKGVFHSHININGCDRAPSTQSTVKVSIDTRCIQVLQIHLIGPNNSRWVLRKSEGGGSVCHENWRYERVHNLSTASVSDGIWSIEVTTNCTNCWGNTIKPWTIIL